MGGDVISNSVKVECAGCGKTISRSQRDYNRSKTKVFYCSKECRHNHIFVELTCANCGEQFSRKKAKVTGQDKCFCSNHCRMNYLQAHGTRPKTGGVVACKNCGREIYRAAWQLERNKDHFCSPECASEYHRGRPNDARRRGEKVNCANCGNELWRTSQEIKDSKTGLFYCNKECFDAYRKSHPLHRVPLKRSECEYCGNEFDHEARYARRFCSNDCYRAWQKDHAGVNHPLTNKIETRCDWCGKKIKVIPARMGYHQHHFCGPECQRIWFSEIHSKSEDFRDTMRESATKWTLETKQKQRITRPQLIANGLLDELGIPFQNETQCGYFAVDNYLVESDLVIEVQGDYWHYHPIRFSRLDERAIRRIGQDKARHTYLKSHKNIEILYLWESDLIEAPEKCCRLIEYYVKNKGQIEEYQSYNYDLYDDILILKRPRIVPFMEYEVDALRELIKQK